MALPSQLELDRSPRPTAVTHTAAGAGGGPRRRRARSPVVRVVTVGLVPLLVAAGCGLPYYVLPLSERIRHPLHPWFAPAGIVGQSAGLAALLLFSFLWLYPIRKRFRCLAFAGPVAAWLDAHIAAGLLLPLVAATHAAWRFTGLIGMGYGIMLLVCMSGVVGRYLYTRIPRSQSGIALGREEIGAERDALVAEIARSTGLPAARVAVSLAPVGERRSARGVLATLRQLVADDFARRRAVGALLDEWRASHPQARAAERRKLRRITRLSRREVALAQQARILDGTLRVFRFWHVAHRPFALTALLAVVIHVIVVIAVGTTWFG